MCGREIYRIFCLQADEALASLSERRFAALHEPLRCLRAFKSHCQRLLADSNEAVADAGDDQLPATDPLDAPFRDLQQFYKTVLWRLRGVFWVTTDPNMSLALQLLEQAESKDDPETALTAVRELKKIQVHLSIRV